MGMMINRGVRRTKSSKESAAGELILWNQGCRGQVTKLGRGVVYVFLLASSFACGSF